MAIIPTERLNLLSSQARIQVPWVKVTIGNYTFGIFTKESTGISGKDKDGKDFSETFKIQYPNYIQSLNIEKINGQINQYTLQIAYPVGLDDDPNFFEKVFSSVSKTRKIVFSYGDAAVPAYTYKDEEAIITSVNQTFGFGNSGVINSVIMYTVKATSTSIVGFSGNYTFVNNKDEKKKPSDEIKALFRNPKYGLQDLFTGMREADLDKFIDGSDKAVQLHTKMNMAVMDYLNYLVSCMIPEGSTVGNISSDIYILTIHDDTTYDRAYETRPIVDGKEVVGPYFKVTRTSYLTTRSDAFNVDIGIGTSTIVTAFSTDNQDGYSIYYDYQSKLNPNSYSRRINDKGQEEEVYAPVITSNNDLRLTRAEDITWWTKITKYPINATLVIQGLLRPATLMSYVRINVIFPGGKKHISSGLYIVTKQIDNIDMSGYRTTLSLTKLEGDLFDNVLGKDIKVLT